MCIIKIRVIGAVLLALCLLTISAAAFAVAPVFPNAQLLSFDPDTFTYTYQVSVSADSSYPFGHFRVLATVPDEGLTGGWVVSGPTVNGEAVNGWISAISRWDADAPADYVDWQATTQAEVRKGTAWVGLFTLVAPNTNPVDGLLFTSDGPGSEHYIDGLVPGGAPSVPEPSSMLVLFTGAAGLLGLRRRQSR